MRLARPLLTRALAHEVLAAGALPRDGPEEVRALAEVALARGDASAALEQSRPALELLEQRAQDLPGTFACLKEAFQLDPDDGDTREELDRVAVLAQAPGDIVRRLLVVFDQ